MSDTANPYQPPRPIISGNETGGLEDRIAIDGQVSIDEVTELFPVPWIVRVLQVLTVVVCAPLFVAMAAGMLFFGTPQPGILPLILIEFFLIGVCWFSWHWLSRRSQTRRLLARQPGMIGPIRGFIDRFGLRFYNEAADQWQQVSWTAFSRVDCTPRGLRLNWLHAAGSFIAIPAAAIDGFENQDLGAVIQQWKADCTQPARFGVVEDWSQRPAGSIAFRQLAGMQQASALPVYHPVNVVSAVASIGILIWSPGLIPTVAMLAIILAGSSWISGRFHPYYVTLLSVDQWGWITTQGFRMYCPGGEIEGRWDEAEEVVVDEARIDILISSEPNSEPNAAKVAFALERTDIEAGDNAAPDPWGQLASWITAARP